MPVSVIVLNRNGLKFISECIQSVLAQTYPEIELIVIDNASTDGSVNLTKKKFPGVHLVENTVNLGFSKAINQGIRASSFTYILPLNFDVILDEDFVSEMVRAIESDRRIGSVSGKLLRSSSLSDSREFENPVIDSTGHVIFKNRYVVNRGEDKVDKGQYNSKEFVFGTCGAAPLYRREMLEDIKLGGEYFDESFFLMLEDVDLDWRAQLKGWKCVYAPKAVAFHHRSASGVQKSRMLQRHYYKNRYLLMLKNDQFWSVLKYFPGILLLELFLHLDLFFTAPAAFFLGGYDLIRLFPQTWRKRRMIQKTRVVSQKDIEEWFQKYNYLADVRRKLGLQK